MHACLSCASLLTLAPALAKAFMLWCTVDMYEQQTLRLFQHHEIVSTLVPARLQADTVSRWHVRNSAGAAAGSRKQQQRHNLHLGRPDAVSHVPDIGVHHIVGRTALWHTVLFRGRWQEAVAAFPLQHAAKCGLQD